MFGCILHNLQHLTFDFVCLITICIIFKSNIWIIIVLFTGTAICQQNLERRPHARDEVGHSFVKF